MINELKNRFKNEIKSLKKQYNTAIITEAELDFIIEEELIKYFEKYYYSYFGRNKFLAHIWKKIATTYQEKLNKDKKQLDILLIELLLEQNKDLTPKEKLYLLSKFFIHGNYQLNQVFAKELLSKNISLTKVIDDYITSISNKSKTISIANLTIPDNLLILIKEYCLKNNIKTTDPVVNLTKALTMNANYMMSEVTLEDLYTMYQINKTKKLTYLEEKRLVIEAKSGNKQSRELLMKNNIYLVIDIALKYTNEFVELQDLIQVGNIALLESIDEYQFDEGCGFKRFATQKIEQALEKYLYETKYLVKITSYEKIKLSKLDKLTEKLTNKLGRIPYDYELATELNVAIEEIRNLKDIEKLPVGLDEYLEEHDIVNYQDFTASIIEEKEVINILKKDVQKLIAKGHLTPREKEIIYLKYGFQTNQELSFKEVAQTLGISKAAANVFEKSALKKLRNLNIKKLSQYMDNPQEALNYIDECNKVKSKQKITSN